MKYLLNKFRNFFALPLILALIIASSGASIAQNYTGMIPPGDANLSPEKLLSLQGHDLDVYLQNLNARQQAWAYANCERERGGDRRFLNCDKLSSQDPLPELDQDEIDASNERDRIEEARKAAEDAKPESSTYALAIYKYAMGEAPFKGNNCLSCDFIEYFMVALTDFSLMVYQYFYQFLIMVAPPTMGLWLAYRAAKLMITGGEDGKEFLADIVKKLALFAFAWMIVFAGAINEKGDFLWHTTGPLYLNYAFSLSNDVRTTTMSGSKLYSDGSQSSSLPDLNCTNLSEATGHQGSSKYEFTVPAKQSVCFTERSHMLGLATGVALALNSYGSGSDTNFGWSEIASWVLFFSNVLLKLFLGAAVIGIYGMSAVWLIFLVLDIVTRGLITAAFSPILVLTYFYKPTRGVTTRAITAMGGAMVTAVALAIINVLAFVLITNTVTVYNSTHADFAAIYDTWPIEKHPTLSADRKVAMGEFIKYVGVSDSADERIPMNFGTPWFWYLLFCGIAIFGIGKKIIKMLEDAVGYSGAAEFANSAVKAVRMGAVGGMGAAGMGLGMGMMGGMMSLKGGSALAGGAATAGGRGLGKASQFLGSALQKGANNKNILAASQMTGSAVDSASAGDS